MKTANLKFSTIALLLLAGLQIASAQTGVKISAAAGTAHPSAMLDVESSNRGLLVPRVNLVSLSDGTNPIASPATGLLVYNLGGGGVPSVGFFYWTGGAWVQLTSGGFSGAGTVNYVTRWTASNALGTGLLFDNGTNVGLGTTAPATLFHLAGAHSTTRARLTLPSGSNSGGSGEINMQLWVSEPNVTWDAGGIGMNVTNDGGSPSGFSRLNTAIGQSYIRFIPNGGAMAFNTTDNAGNLSNTMYMTGGNVGIGTTSPADKLHVNGSLRIQNGVLNTGTDNLQIFSGVNADDNSYEWIGFYSGGTRQGIILYDGAWGGANGLTNEFSLSAEGGNLLTLNTQANHIALMPKSGNVGIGTTAPVAKLDVEGEIRQLGVYKLNNNAETTYEWEAMEYIIEAGPSMVGVVKPMNMTYVNQLCRDKNGCHVTIQMINWDGAGNTASRHAMLFLSETNNTWRFSENDIAGTDGVTSQDWGVYDCYFSDAETTGGGNARVDNAIGFGLLNASGGSYSDATTTCRIVIRD